MKYSKWKFFLGAVIIITAFLFIHSSSAQTIISRTDASTFRADIKIIFDFQDISDNQAGDLIKKWADGIDAIWNHSNLCKRIDYFFELRKMENGKTCADFPDWHCIKVVGSDKNVRGNVADVTFSMANSNKNSAGEWSMRTSGLEAAHEFGHLIGLKDEYHYEENNGQKTYVNDLYQKSGRQSIMAQTWGSVRTFDSQEDGILKSAGLTYEDSDCLTDLDVKIPEMHKFYFSSGKRISIERLSEREIIGSLVKGETDPAIYFVSSEGKLRWVRNEETALKLFGDGWQGKITWFNDAIIYTYEFGEPLN